MGWTSFESSSPFNLILVQEFNKDGYEVVEYNEIRVQDPDPEFIEAAEMYAAVKHPKGYVFGLVVLFKRNTDGEIFYKDMDESVGPHYYDASEKVLNALSDHKDFPYEASQYSKDWRSECLKRI